MLRAGPVVQGFAYVAIGLAASSFLTFPVAVQLLKPRKLQSLAPIAAPKDIESSLDIQVGAQIYACLMCYRHEQHSTAMHTSITFALGTVYF